MSILNTIKSVAAVFTATSPKGKTRTYITVTNLDGQSVQILAADEQRHYEDQLTPIRIRTRG